jgi:glycogen operon protein
MLLVLLNAHHEPLPFTLPAHKRSVRWQMILNTAATKQGKKQSTLLRGGTPYNLHA